jgi:iron-sulfur cluster assembly protein
MEMLMNMNDQTTSQAIFLTETAAQAVQELMDARNLQGYSLRVFVAGGGCSGLQYGMSLDNHTRPEDVVTDTGGIKVLLDEVSIQYLFGATIDYLDGPNGSGFKILNPNKISCGCGSASGNSDGGGCSGCG